MAILCLFFCFSVILNRPVMVNSDSEEESVIRKPGHQGGANPLASPEVRHATKPAWHTA